MKSEPYGAIADDKTMTAIYTDWIGTALADGKVKNQMTELEKILLTEYSTKFDEIRKNMIAVSHFKYGWVKDTYEVYKTADAMKSLEMRIRKYAETGNTEYLADIANFAMIEYMYPQHPRAFYKATDSNESPGLHGMGINEVRQFSENNHG